MVTSVLFGVWVFLAVIIGAVWFGRYVVAVRLSARRQTLSAQSYDRPPDPPPRVCVLVAAKDEEGNIEACLRSLLDQDYPNRWITKTGILEPVVTLVWHMILDVPKWFRFASLLRTSLAYRILWFPPFLLFSAIAHASEMTGMYATMIAPQKTKRWAENP